MRRIFFIAAFFLFIISAFGFIQIKTPVKKLYGYKQAGLPGILPDYSDDNDIKPAGKKPKQNYNYWFYLEIPKTERITLKSLWISGIAHDIKSETIKQLPVRKTIFTGLENNDTIIMVPATNNKVMLVYPAGESKDTTIRSKYVRSLTTTNELVISYIWKNKTYYATLKKLKELQPDIRV